MSWDNLPLLLILMLSVVGKNQSVAVAAVVLLAIKLAGLDHWFPMIETKGFSVGLTILTAAILVPIANGHISLREMGQSFISPMGLIGIAAGIFAAWAAFKGLTLIQVSPDVISSVIVGTLIGVCFFHGIPIGPLIAGGLVSLVLSLLAVFKFQ